MEKSIDNLLNSIFGQFQPGVLFANIIVGVVLLLLGISLVRRISGSGKKTMGWILVVIGCLGLLSGFSQLILSFA